MSGRTWKRLGWRAVPVIAGVTTFLVVLFLLFFLGHLIRKEKQDTLWLQREEYEFVFVPQQETVEPLHLRCLKDEDGEPTFVDRSGTKRSNPTYDDANATAYLCTHDEENQMELSRRLTPEPALFVHE
jgi:hypothetical protein